MVAEAHTVNHCALLVLPVMVTRNVPLSSGWKCFHDFQGLKVRIWSSGNWKVWVQNNATIICACVTLPNPWLHLFPCHPEDSIPQYRQGQGGQRGSTARLRDLLRYSCDGTGGSPDLTWISSAWLLSHSQKMVRGQMKPSWLKLPLSKFLWGQLALFCPSSLFKTLLAFTNCRCCLNGTRSQCYCHCYGNELFISQISQFFSFHFEGMIISFEIALSSFIYLLLKNDCRIPMWVLRAGYK